MDAARMIPPSHPPLASPYAAVNETGKPTLEEAATDFAAVFYQKLLKHAWKAGGFLSGGPEAQSFYDQLSWEYARVLAKRSDRGVADMIMKSLQPRNRIPNVTMPADAAADRPALPPRERTVATGD